jgi:hypothetical protein
VLLLRRWLVSGASHFRRLANDYERLPRTVAGLHFVAFACPFLHRTPGNGRLGRLVALTRWSGPFRNPSAFARRRREDLSTSFR